MGKVVIENCALYHGDAFGILPHISECDAVITDPPYGCTRNKWDQPLNLDKFWSALKASARAGAPICVFCQMPFAGELYVSNKENFRYDIVYTKPKITGFLDARKKPMKAHELIYIFCEKVPPYNPQMLGGFAPYKKRRYGNSSNWGKCFRFTSASDGSRYPLSILDPLPEPAFYTAAAKPYPQHPTQKSLPALLWLVKTYTSPGELVLDPFMGSGTCGVACALTGRRFIGVEQDREYFETASRRIRDAYYETSLLYEAAAKPERAALS